MGLSLALVVLVAALFPVGVRTLIDVRRASERLAAARAAHDGAREILELGRAIRAFPVSRAPTQQASRELEALARSAESAGDVVRAREAWRELRSAWFAVRGATDPGRRWIEVASIELARLGAEREARIEPRLSAPGPSVVAALALVGWAVAAIGVFRHGIEPNGRLRLHAARSWLIALAIGLAIWGTALLAA